MKALITLIYLILTATCLFAIAAGTGWILSGKIIIGIAFIAVFAPIGYFSLATFSGFFKNLSTPS